jgi:hypothetical protein
MKKNSPKTFIIILVIFIATCIVAYSAIKNSTSNESPKDFELVNGYTLQIDTTYNLYVFKPSFSRIELAIETMPSKDNDSIVFCAAAAFTKSIRKTFSIDNIVGGYISGDVVHNICATPSYYGRFVYGDDQWKFIETDNFPTIYSIISQKGSMFTQRWVIKNSEIYRPYARGDSTDNRFIYRALCEKNDSLMIAQSNHFIPYNLFVKALKAYGIENALYMDMGSGWNHSFYRDTNNDLHIIFPKTHNHCTNWITFYK